MTIDGKLSRAAWDRSGAVDHVLHVPTLHSFSRLQPFLGSNSMYTLRDDKLLEYNAVERLQFAASAFPLSAPSFSPEVAETMHLERCAVKRPGVTKLDDDENDAHLPVACAYAIFFRKIINR